MRGLDYRGREKSEDGKAVFNKPGPAGRMLPPCNCKQSLKGKTRKCKEFLSENRQVILKEFWEKLNWQEQTHKHHMKIFRKRAHPNGAGQHARMHREKVT
ncbi:hypothetical protein ILUMI_17371 [Ignelater luminosus]|uniref:Uncharacterized protein n=1 Tax=Ignelater luminosus TaxID=2038154 RepID=A0A8K0CR52_IGNLU|nr:hypothetical protein ILUMI_17371 [Ignelater luminosus]